MIDATVLERLGVFVDDADGEYKRYRPRTRDARYDPTDPQAELRGKLISYRSERVPHPVVLALATDPRSVEEARKKAVATGADFYHPKLGWLRGGLKRETERPENLGAGSVVYESDEVIVGEPEQDRALPKLPMAAREQGKRDVRQAD